MAELTINADEIAAALARHVADYTPEVSAEQVGRWRSVTASPGCRACPARR